MFGVLCGSLETGRHVTSKADGNEGLLSHILTCAIARVRRSAQASTGSPTVVFETLGTGRPLLRDASPSCLEVLREFSLQRRWMGSVGDWQIANPTRELLGIPTR